MVEKQAGIQVIVKIHQKRQTALFHLDEFTALIELPVFRTALATLTRLERNACARRIEYLAGNAGDLAHACPCHIGRYFGRRAVFLDMQMRGAGRIGIDIDGRGVFRQILVVGSPCVNTFAFQTLAQMA